MDENKKTILHHMDLLLTAHQEKDISFFIKDCSTCDPNPGDIYPFRIKAVPGLKQCPECKSCTELFFYLNAVTLYLMVVTELTKDTFTQGTPVFELARIIKSTKFIQSWYRSQKK